MAKLIADYEKQDQYKEAEPRCKRSIIAKARDPDHPDTRAVQENYACIYAAQAHAGNSSRSLLYPLARDWRAGKLLAFRGCPTEVTDHLWTLVTSQHE